MCSYKYFADKSLIVSRCSSSFPCVACAIPNLSTVRVDHNTSRSRIDWKWLKWNSISTRKHIRGYECWMHCCTVYNLYNNLYNMYITLDASRISIWQIQSGFFPRWPGHSSKVASSFDKSPPSWKQTSGVCNWHQLLVNLIFCESESPAFQWIILLNCHFEKFSTSHLLLMYSERKTHSHQDTNDPFAGANYFDCVRKWIPWTDFCTRSAGKRDPRGVLQLLGWRDRDIPTRSSKCVERMKYHDPRVIH